MHILPNIKAFISDEHAATAIEYALIASIVSISIVVSVTSVRVELQSIFTQVAAGFQAATN